MSKVPLARALLSALKDYGAGEVFGIPGDFALPFFREIERSAILPLYTLAHEPAVGFAADAASRYRSSLGVAAVTYGAGALNMVNPVAQAYAEKSPLVVISGAPGAGEGKAGLGLHHQVKRLDTQLAVYREITVDQAVLDDAHSAPAEIARVLTRARTLSRPVYIEFPRDMVEVPVEPVPPFEPVKADPEAVEACARAILERLRGAKAPALLLGVEIRRYGIEDQIARLAKRLGIPAAVSFMGRGILADTDAPLIGTYLGLAGEERVRAVIEGSDALLMLGVILCDTNFGVSERQIDRRHAVHAFDGEVRFAHNTYPGIPLGDLTRALVRLAEPIGGTAPEPPPAYPRGMIADASPIAPNDIAAAVNDLFARHGRMPITSDIGDCLFTAMDIANTALLAPGYYATMGPGVPFGLGVAAQGKRPLILVGDGAFQMTGWEIAACSKYGWAPIVLLFNNQSWEMLRAFQPGPAYHDLLDLPYWRIADDLGGRGQRVATRAELAAALEAAYADQSCFQLIEIRLAKGQVSRTLARFVAAARRLSVLGKDG